MKDFKKNIKTANKRIDHLNPLKLRNTVKKTHNSFKWGKVICQT